MVNLHKICIIFAILCIFVGEAAAFLFNDFCINIHYMPHTAPLCSGLYSYLTYILTTAFPL